MTYPSKTPEAQREYQKGIPKELKKIYQERYEMKQRIKKQIKKKNADLKNKRQIIDYILRKLIEKCQFIQESESIRGVVKVKSRYLCQEDIEATLKSLF